MNALIVYYSMLGNTDFVAKEISKQLNADLLRIEPEKMYPDTGFKKFLWGGKSAVMGEMPKLKPYSFLSGNYDTIILGTPVWASNIAPPLRTFVHDNKSLLVSKHIAVFMCSGGGNSKKACDKLKDLLETDYFEAEISLIDPKEKYNDNIQKTIDKFCADLISTSL